MARRAVASMNYGPKAVPTDDMVQTFGKLNRATRNMIKDIHKSTYLSSKAKEVLDECKSKKLSRDRARTVLANRLVETLVQNTDRSSGWAIPITFFVYGRAKTNSPYLWKGNIQWEYVAESFMDDYPGESGFTERTETPVRFGKMAASANAKPSVPVGPDGYVPTEAIMRRDAERTARARTMDSRTTAKTVFTPPLTPEEASKWWNAPGRYDVEGVDTAPKKSPKGPAKPHGVRPKHSGTPGFDAPPKMKKPTPIVYSDDIAQRFADTISRIRRDLHLDKYTLEVIDRTPYIVFSPEDADLEDAFDRYGVRFDQSVGAYTIRLDSPYAIGQSDGGTAKPRRRAKRASDVSQPVGGAKAPRKGFFGGLSPRRSGYADLDWVGDPYTASMIAGETLSDEMVKAYRDAAFREIDEQEHECGWEVYEWASANRRRRGGRR